MHKVEILQPVTMRVDGKYAELSIGAVVEVTDGVCASMVSLGQAKKYVAPPAIAEDKKGGRK